MKNNHSITATTASLAFAGGIALGNAIVIGGVFISRYIRKHYM